MRHKRYKGIEKDIWASSSPIFPQSPCLFQPGTATSLLPAQKFLGHSPPAPNSCTREQIQIKGPHQTQPWPPTKPSPGLPSCPRKAKTGSGEPSLAPQQGRNSTACPGRNPGLQNPSWAHTQTPNTAPEQRFCRSSSSEAMNLTPFCSVLNISLPGSCMFIHSTLLRLLFSFIPFPISVSSLIFMHFYFHLYTFHHFNILIFQQSN